MGRVAVACALLFPAAATEISRASGTGPGSAMTAAPVQGYWLAGADGSVYGFGAAAPLGTVPAGLRRPIAGVATTPSGQGYWLVGADGGVFSFGDAAFHGSTGGMTLNRPIVGAAASPTGAGYWFVAADGGIFSFGDATFHGSTGRLRLNRPVVGMAATPTGRGYWLVAADGGIFAFGDARFHGSTGGMRLNRPIVGMAPTPTGAGYWLVASDGGVFAFGDAAFHGSTGAMRLNAPIVGLSPTPTGRGYWFVAADGGVFNFGDAAFVGSAGGRALAHPITAMAAVPSGAVRPSQGPAGPSAPAPRPDPDSGPAPDDGAPAPPPDTAPDQPTTPPPVPVAPAAPGVPFDVALIGDTGYSTTQERVLLDVRDDIDAAGAALTIHIGDIWSEAGASCSAGDYQAVRAVFDGFAAPVVYTPGDNEWTDCPGSTSGALNRIRDIFFPTDETLGQHRMSVARHPTMRENARFTHGGVVFVTINEPGASGRGGSHRDNNIEWLNAAFDQAEATGAPGVVVGWHDNPFEPSGGRLAKALQARATTFGRPVVLVHGDTHHAQIDHPWSSLPNFTRVEVQGDSSSGDWYRMTVDPQSPTVFSFKRESA